jgi:hypothetical protein
MNHMHTPGTNRLVLLLDEMTLSLVYVYYFNELVSWTRRIYKVILSNSHLFPDAIFK